MKSLDLILKAPENNYLMQFPDELYLLLLLTGASTETDVLVIHCSGAEIWLLADFP